MSLVWKSDTAVSCFEKWAISLLLFLMSLVASSLRPCHLSEFDRNRACILVCPSQPRPQGTFPWLLKRPGDEVVSILKTDKENWLKNGSNSFQVSFIEMSIRSGGPSYCYSIILFLFPCLLIFLFHESLHVVSKIQTCYPLRSPGRFILNLLTKLTPRFKPFTVFLLPAFAWVKLCPKPWHTRILIP